MGLGAEIWASKFGWEKRKKIPHTCESIGHGPLRGRCPKGSRGTQSLYLMPSCFSFTESKSAIDVRRFLPKRILIVPRDVENDGDLRLQDSDDGGLHSKRQSILSQVEGEM